MAVDLLELAERCEAAEGPDRGLDAEVAAACRFFPKGVGFVWKAGLRPNSPEIGRVECCTNLGAGGPQILLARGGECAPIPPVTAQASISRSSAAAYFTESGRPPPYTDHFKR